MPEDSYCGVPNERCAGLRGIDFSPANNYSGVVVDNGRSFYLWTITIKKGMAGRQDRDVLCWLAVAAVEPLFFDHRRRYHSVTDGCDVWPEIFLDDVGYDFFIHRRGRRSFRMGRLFNQTK